jgi:GDP-4-dehydro-6-deoxy-D-mannose reductase
VGLARAPVAVAPQAERFRPGEARRLVGTAAKLARACGWRPEIPLEKTLADMLEWWRARVKESESVSG